MHVHIPARRTGMSQNSSSAAARAGAGAGTGASGSLRGSGGTKPFLFLVLFHGTVHAWYGTDAVVRPGTDTYCNYAIIEVIEAILAILCCFVC